MTFKDIMTRNKTTDFFIACKESRIETNTNFYGCFYLGPFDDSLTQTLANDLRRTVLSELTGLAITSVEIEGVLHKFSNLPGMKESVLDLICNLQNIVLKKQDSNGVESKIRPTKKTYTGFLIVRGPRVIKASDLKLPAGIQCVDPNQYIVTLAEDGFINMKLQINEGKNFIKQKQQNLDVNSLKKRNILIQNFKKNSVFSSPSAAVSIENESNQMGLTTKSTTNIDTNAVRLSNPIPLDAVFMPVTKINCIIEENNIYSDFATDQAYDMFYPEDSLNLYINETEVDKFNEKNELSKLNKIYKKSRVMLNRSLNNTNISSNLFMFDAFLNSIDYLKPLPINPKTSIKAANDGKETMPIKLAPWHDNNIYSLTSDQNFELNLLIPNGNLQSCATSWRSLSNDKLDTLQESAKTNSINATKLSNSFTKVKSFLTSKTVPVKQQHLVTTRNFLKTKKQIMTQENARNNIPSKLGFLKTNTSNCIGSDSVGALLQDTSLKINPLNLVNQENLKLEYFKTLKLKPLRKKSHLIVEIWTNGSLHPRQALYHSFMFLSNNFLKLQSVRMIGSMFKSDLAYGNLKYSIVNNYNLTSSGENLQSNTTKIAPTQRLKNRSISLTQNSMTNLSKQLNTSGENLRSSMRDGALARSRTFYLQNSLKIPLGILNLSLRTYTALKKAEIFTLKDLLQYSKTDLLKINNIGVKALMEIECCLAELSLTLNTTL